MKVYSHLRILWAAWAASIVVSFFNNIFSHSFLASLLFLFLAIACNVVLLYAIHSLIPWSKRLNRAFFMMLGGTILSVLASVMIVLPTNAVMFSVFSMLLLLTASIFLLIGQYDLYWGMDETIIPNGYAFPARRLRWCFYLPILSSILLSFVPFITNPVSAIEGTFDTSSSFYLINSIATLIINIVVLILLWQFIRAVKQREDDPLPSYEP